MREQITSGRLGPNAALPSTAELAQQYGVASETARLAITRLKEEGLVVGRAGAGVHAASQFSWTYRFQIPDSGAQA
ncbi:hypothetical protein FAIPA1_110105 [Frankia sp. AiPs1]|uniref:winged helix-turn-helix domain-containing protein n=1 Tax=Frankia sp. AiPa1 TaxID=573492 RepID=UPI00202B4DDB|nr:winged helix-turn-helix domain-containing protein [Frankia sp. AiPa1]MCL9757720.1 winged helix-turn-helix domain-containing protein [Frankia sp. AiPa1]